MPEELLPVATSSVWVREPKAGQWGVLGYKGVGFGQDAAEITVINGGAEELEQ